MSENAKPSRFNVFVPDGDGRHLVYNTLTGSLSRAGGELPGLLSNGGFDDFVRRELPCSPDVSFFMGEMESQGVITGNDEIAEYKAMHERWKSGREQVEFNALLTYDCNFECPYCYQGRGEKGRAIHGFKTMPRETLESTKKFIRNTAVEKGAKKVELVLYGGEPFMPGVREMGQELADETAEWARANGRDFRLHALSNGSYIDKSLVEWLDGYRARIQIPVDGDDAMHDKYRFWKDTKEGSFNHITKVLGMTKGTGVETHIRISLTDETAPTMMRLLDQLAERGLTHIYPDFCYITAFTDACQDFAGHTLSDNRLFKIMPELWRAAHERGFPLDIRPQVKPLPCSSIADGSFIVDPFGNVYKCWELVGLPEHIVGRLDGEGKMERTAVYSDVLKRNPLEIDGCKGHNYLPACGGGCVCKAKWKHGTYHAPGCGTELFLLKDKIKVYTETAADLNYKPFHKLPLRNGDHLGFQSLEGRQAPQISHCYVLV